MKQNEWWKWTFGEEYLSAFGSIYSQERAKIETKFIIRQLKLKQGDSVLDIACGQGRHAIEFASNGINVVGVDYSSFLLRAARARTLQAGVSPTLIKGDMRRLNLKKVFDAVIILGNAFGYFQDQENERVIAGVAKHLKRRSIFILDLSNTAGMLRSPLGISRWKIPGGAVTAENISFDPATFSLLIRWTIHQGKHVQKFSGRLRLYTLPEIRVLLAKHHFKIIRVFGSLDGMKFNLDSPRCLIFAEKV